MKPKRYRIYSSSDVRELLGQSEAICDEALGKFSGILNIAVRKNKGKLEELRMSVLGFTFLISRMLISQQSEFVLDDLEDDFKSSIGNNQAGEIYKQFLHIKNDEELKKSFIQWMADHPIIRTVFIESYTKEWADNLFDQLRSTVWEFHL